MNQLYLLVRSCFADPIFIQAGTLRSLLKRSKNATDPTTRERLRTARCSSCMTELNKVSVTRLPTSTRLSRASSRSSLAATPSRRRQPKLWRQLELALTLLSLSSSPHLRLTLAMLLLLVRSHLFLSSPSLLRRQLINSLRLHRFSSPLYHPSGPHLLVRMEIHRLLLPPLRTTTPHYATDHHGQERSDLRYRCESCWIHVCWTRVWWRVLGWKGTTWYGG